MANITVPNSWVNGDVIDATEVNNNFLAITDGLSNGLYEINVKLIRSSDIALYSAKMIIDSANGNLNAEKIKVNHLESPLGALAGNILVDSTMVINSSVNLKVDGSFQDSKNAPGAGKYATTFLDGSGFQHALISTKYVIPQTVTLNVSGISTPATYDIKAQRTGDLVALTLPASATYTANANTFTIYPLPTELVPATDRYASGELLIDDGMSANPIKAAVKINSVGELIIERYKLDGDAINFCGNAWTTGTRKIGSCVLTYSLT